MQDALHEGQLVKHDVVGEAARLHAHEAADDEDERHVQADDAATDSVTSVTSVTSEDRWAVTCKLAMAT